MKYLKILTLLLFAMSLNACQNEENNNSDENPSTYKAGTFGYDLDFLSRKDSVIVLKTRSGQGQLIVSAKYQGKVFTSSAGGLKGESFGWINYDAFDGETDPHMNAYGGENRLWLGPEGGKYSVFFKPGSEMKFENWVTPPAIDTESWTVLSVDEQSVSLLKETTLLNYAGTELNMRIGRNIRILENKEIEQLLDIQQAESMKAVGFSTDNAVTNTGEESWTPATGAPCLWVLDMFKPSPATTIVIPYNTDADTKVATTDYFGQIPEDRIKYNDGILFFKADGKSRGKLGLGPERAQPLAGSYDSEDRILTITTFDVDPDAVYLNQEWNTEKDPLTGDAINAYNDGPLEDGSQMGPFYEIESVSPAAFLEPGHTLTHRHNVFHFTGEETALNQVANKLLGVSLGKIRQTFK